MSPATRTATGEGHRIHVLGSEIKVRISSDDTAGRFTVFEAEIPAHSGPPLHSHPHQDEWWYIVEGDFRFVVDGFEVRAKAGDTLFAPKGSRHTFQNLTAQPGRLVTTVVPGGIDTFFEEIQHAAPEGTAPNPAALMPIFRKYGQELHGPPL